MAGTGLCQSRTASAPAMTVGRARAAGTPASTMSVGRTLSAVFPALRHGGRCPPYAEVIVDIAVRRGAGTAAGTPASTMSVGRTLSAVFPALRHGGRCPPYAEVIVDIAVRRGADTGRRDSRKHHVRRADTVRRFPGIAPWRTVPALRLGLSLISPYAVGRIRAAGTPASTMSVGRTLSAVSPVLRHGGRCPPYAWGYR